MATTNVNITIGFAANASPSAVAIAPGDTVYFVGDPQIPTKLCMTEATASILGLSTGALVPAGGSLSATIQDGASGNYCIKLQTTNLACPNPIACSQSGSGTNLFIESAGSSGSDGEGDPEPGGGGPGGGG